MKQIREWLESPAREYAAGVALFEAHGRSGVLKRLVAGSCTDYTREVLARELEKLADSPAIAGNEPPVLCDAHVILVPIKSPTVAAKADSLCDAHVISEPAGEDIRRQRRKLFADRDYLHASLELLPTEAQRLEAALQLLAVVKRIQLSYDVAAGRVVEPTPTPGPDLASLTDAGEIRRLLANLKPQRSKLKKRPDRADALAAVEADIALLEEKLNP